MRGIARGLTALGHALWRPLLRRRLGRVVLERVEGLPLVVLPEVFHPVVFRSGAFLARVIGESPKLAPETPNARAFDLGTGSGVGAVFLARRGWRVTAADVNPQAVRCARLNALLHGFEAVIEAREGDLFAPVGEERFGLVVFNPPYFRGRPRDALDAAWRGETILERFAAGLEDVLEPGGRVLLLLSTDGDCRSLLEELRRRGFDLAVLDERRFGNETLTAWLGGREKAP